MPIISVQVCNADSRSVLKTYNGKSIVQDSLIVENSAIYFIDINPMGTQYIDFEINYKVNDKDIAFLGLLEQFLFEPRSHGDVV